jgi:dipeptidase
MCDILVATAKVTENGEMLFAKNSDRDPNEAQILEYIPRQKNLEKEVKLTYVAFPQVEETYAVILSRPWWMWGSEMGTNEFGLTIGNTAVFTKEPCDEVGILGMDMLRLALERRKTAKEALEFLISIIENPEQGGSGSYEHKFLYHNSFVIVDPQRAFVLETAGKFWATKEIKDVYSISNALSIVDDWDSASKDLVEHAAERGWCKNKGRFSFEKCYSDRFNTYFAHGRERRAFTYQKLKEKQGEISLEFMIEMLQSHQKEPFKPQNGSTRDVCMHYGGLTRPSQVASSQISELDVESQVHWFTGTSNPCLSLFKPVSFEGGIPELGLQPTNKYNPDSYWWQFEKFHREFQTNYQAYIEGFAKDKKQLQGEIIEKEKQLWSSKINAESDQLDLTEWSFRTEKALLDKWAKKVKPGRLPPVYEMNWRRVNVRAELTL